MSQKLQNKMESDRKFPQLFAEEMNTEVLNWWSLRTHCFPCREVATLTFGSFGLTGASYILFQENEAK